MNESPINKSRKVENQYNVGLSCHATLDESLEYIRNVNPKNVITDSFRNQTGADTLANQINGNLQILKPLHPNLLIDILKKWMKKNY